MKLKINKFHLFIMILSFLSVNIFSAQAFDANDLTPPTVMSMNVLTPELNASNELIAIEVIVEDDRNWVQISSQPTLGYSFQLQLTNLPPNCQTATSSFSKLEILEDLAYRSNFQNNYPKRQRFILIGFAPHPKNLESNCPEYRNLNVDPAVALNTNNFQIVTNKVTKSNLVTSNVLTPSLIDESGRTTPSKVYGGINEKTLKYIRNEVGITKSFCVPQNIFPANNPQLSNSLQKYLSNVAFLKAKNIVPASSELIDNYISHTSAWTKLSNDFSPATLANLKGCNIAYNFQQILGEFQKLNNVYEVIIKDLSMRENQDICEQLNARVLLMSDLAKALLTERVSDSNYQLNLSKIKNLKPYSCQGISLTQLTNVQDVISNFETLLNANLNIAQADFCYIRDQQKIEFLRLRNNLMLRYGKSFELEKELSIAGPFFLDDCPLKPSPTEFTKFAMSTNLMIHRINTVIDNFVRLERQNKIVITIYCVQKKKTITKTGMRVSCGKGFSERKLDLSKIANL